MIREAIFDLDGTLLDSLPGIDWAAAQALSACDLPPLRDTLRPFLGPPIRVILQKAAQIPSGEVLDLVERAFRASYDSEGWRKTVCFKGAVEALECLHARGVRLWVATNKNRLATGKILRECGIDGLFQEVVCRDSRTPPFSSKAEMLSDLLDRRQLQREECVMIGDTSEDYLAARSAGIPAALFAGGYGLSASEEWPPGCERLESLSELPLLVLNRGAP